MIFKKFKNTLEKGSVRYVIFQEDKSWYGVALEFNIVVEGDDQASTYLNLVEAVKGYLNTARAKKIRPHVLNQSVSSEYSKLWKDLQAGKEPVLEKYSEGNGQEESPIQVFNYGILPQAA